VGRTAVQPGFFALVLLSAVLFLVACGGGQSGAEPSGTTEEAQSYISVLKAHYLPAREALLATFAPCHFSTDWQLCRQRNIEFATEVKQLMTALTATPPPASLAGADAKLHQGLMGLIELVTKQNACIDGGKEDACASFSLCCNPSAVDLNNAIGELNEAFPSAKLPPPNE
jgi:hypothetical protein